MFHFYLGPSYLSGIDMFQQDTWVSLVMEVYKFLEVLEDLNILNYKQNCHQNKIYYRYYIFLQT